MINHDLDVANIIKALRCMCKECPIADCHECRDCQTEFYVPVLNERERKKTQWLAIAADLLEYELTDKPEGTI